MIERITDIQVLSKFVPKLLKLHGELDGKWEPDLTAEEFLQALLDNFEPDSYYFGELSETGEIICFSVITSQSKTKGLFWLFYMNKNFRDLTKAFLVELKTYMKGQGFSTIYTQSTRTTSSYERWLEKFGAEKVAIVYKFKL